MEESGMRRLYWMVPALAAVALVSYLVAKPANAPAEPQTPTQTPPIQDSTTPPKAPELPITQVTLYSSGLGYFQRDGQVEGNGRIDLSFPVDDINDLLKSMVLQDLGGGKISAVSFDSHDPLNKTLNSFAIRLADNPSYAAILNQARGEKVEVTLHARQASTGPETLHGTIVGVETKTMFGDPTTPPQVVANYYRGNKDCQPAETLIVLCAEGLCNVPLAEVQSVKFQNPTVDREVRRALEVLASAHDNQKKSVSLQFNGTGKRDVRVGYVVETPLWRTSYRLLIKKDGKLFIQGWALVDNPSSEDWKDVRMTLVSGRPVSFKMDLYQPLYADRPVVQSPVQTAIGPTYHERSVLALGTTATAGTPANPVGLQPAYNNGPNVLAPPPPVPPQFQAGPTAMPQQPARGPGDLDGSIHNALGANTNQQINLQNGGVVVQAKAVDFGSSFQYAIEQPVSIPRQKSAMLPIVNNGLEGDKVSVYSPTVHTKYPLLALRLKNSTGLHLMQGPVTVLEGQGYAGDAQLPELQPGEDRLLSYAVDLGTEVDSKREPAKYRMESIRLHKGVFTVHGIQREAVTYTLTNRSPQDRTVLVEHPLRSDYRLVSEHKPREKTRELYRFEQKVAAGKTVHLEVIEERDSNQQTALIGLDTKTIRFYLQGEFSNADARAALEKLLDLRGKLKTTEDELARLQQQLRTITTDQDRLRANLKEMPATSAAHQRYLEKFDKQETVIEKLQEQIQTTGSQYQKQQEAAEAYLNGLDLETTIKQKQ
jgi:hypothetical protein